MKTLTTIFAIAVMVFAFNANPVMAAEDDGPYWECPQDSIVDGERNLECRLVSEIKDLEQPDNERDVADSGSEPSTSVASASDQ